MTASRPLWSAPGLKLALSQARKATPPKPMTKPSTRSGVRRWPSQTKATTAVHSGVVALTMLDRPAVIDRAANENSTKGMALFNAPTSSSPRQCRRNSPNCPREASSGISRALARPTRTAASATGPKAWAPRRMNRNDAPHSAASSTSSPRSKAFIAPQPPVRAGPACAAARRHSRSTIRRHPPPGGRESGWKSGCGRPPHPGPGRHRSAPGAGPGGHRCPGRLAGSAAAPARPRAGRPCRPGPAAAS
mmetsp:Transcript_53826/g.149330  ORF Transcript_53826/g.149330 Transcript_53826/m.149330 type:complete len:248 (-) Transcript_53826:561-1304(-)